MNDVSDRLMNGTVRALGRILLDALITGLSHYAAAYHGLPPLGPGSDRDEETASQLRSPDVPTKNPPRSGLRSVDTDKNHDQNVAPVLARKSPA